MFKVYNNSDVCFMDHEKNGKVYHDVLSTKDGYILSGNDCFVGNFEKRRAVCVVHVEFPYTCANYALFYKGTENKLIYACKGIDDILSGSVGKSATDAIYGRLIDCLHIVQHRNTSGRKSKLNGINSLSTSCCDNSFCLFRTACNDSVCSHCYSATQQKMQLALQDNNIVNGIILRNVEIPVRAWKKYMDPVNLSKFFRFESFGDVQNVTQAINYINLCSAFPRVHFAAWTKNTGIWHFAFEKAGKPKNLSFVVSSNKVNVPELYHVQNNKNIDHVFTVFDKKFAAENNININCGGRACMDCIRKHKNCYFTDTEKNICELLK